VISSMLVGVFFLLHQ